VFLSATLAVALAAGQPAPSFEFKDGDRIVWIGGTLVEREQRYGYWETALLAAHPDKNITLRNLGWSGDTVGGESRGRFDYANPDKCFRQLVDQTLELKPTVIFVGYGTNESFEGEAGLPKFEKGLGKLLDALKPANARIVLFTPPRVNVFESPAGSPEPKQRNAALALYGDAIRKVAEQRRLGFADLHKEIGRAFEVEEIRRNREPPPEPIGPFTDNGLHLTGAGYQHTIGAFLRSLGIGPPAIDWAKLEPLRQAVIEKNQLFFHRWRPQNETYLFGFRKHEQGKNAKEVAEFDPLVSKAEEEIAKIRMTLSK
jgi:lysophospholipase L1-like esterase